MKTNSKIYENWTPEIWFGNPELNLQCVVRTFKNPLNGKQTNIWIFGGTEEYKGFNFCVNAGANSDYSYTGFCKDMPTIETAAIYVDHLYNTKKLFV